MTHLSLRLIVVLILAVATQVRGFGSDPPRPHNPGRDLLIQHHLSIELDDGVLECVAIYPNGEWVAGCGQRHVQLFDIETGELIYRLEEHDSTILSVAFSPSGETVRRLSMPYSAR